MSDPAHLPIRQWRTVVEELPAVFNDSYSYGDSAGFTPASLLMTLASTKFKANVEQRSDSEKFI
jgi:hypothetical protein